MDSEPARVGSSVKTPDKHVIWSVRGRARRRQYADEPVRDTLYLHRRMPRRARVHLLSLRSSLVNLPISIYGPLLERNIASPSSSLAVSHPLTALVLAPATCCRSPHMHQSCTVHLIQAAFGCEQSRCLRWLDWHALRLVFGPLQCR